MAKIFILEDDPNRVEAFYAVLDCNNNVIHHAISVEAAKELFNAPYDLILLDHDLGGEQMVDSSEENTGYQFAKWLSDIIGGGDIIIHSWNPEGAKLMAHILSHCTVVIQPFSAKLLRWLLVFQ